MQIRSGAADSTSPSVIISPTRRNMGELGVRVHGKHSAPNTRRKEWRDKSAGSEARRLGAARSVFALSAQRNNGGRSLQARRAVHAVGLRRRQSLAPCPSRALSLTSSPSCRDRTLVVRAHPKYRAPSASCRHRSVGVVVGASFPSPQATDR